MKLLQAKVRCVSGITDTTWFEPGKGVTVITGSGHTCSRLMRSLEAINPIQPLDVLQPFSGHPEFWQQGSYRRRVLPSRKTASYMIFEAFPELVRMLGEIDASLYETDRIETGRRLDGSRWYSFVELSESARWSDLEDKMQCLYDRYRQSGGKKITEFHGSDRISSRTRIKAETARLCTGWLHLFARLTDPESKKLVQACREIVLLNQRFKLARRVAGEYLPLTVRVSPEFFCKPEYPLVDSTTGGKGVTDPITSLFNALRYRYLSSKTRFDPELLYDVIEKASGRIAAYWPGAALYGLPRLNEGRMTVSMTNSTTVAHRYLQTVWIITLLAMALRDQEPLLLLDTGSDTLSEDDWQTILNGLQQASCGSQILLYQHENTVTPAAGARCLHIDSDGTISSR